MIRFFSRAAAAGSIALAFLALSAGSAMAAESYDNCNGVITSVPATITTQGVWCMKKSLVHSVSSGAAITIAANNVTVDCNHFNLDASLAASASDGIRGNVLNATIRNCGIRGFRNGIEMDGSGHLVEDNHLDGNYRRGISLAGSNHRVVRNRVFNMLGAPGTANSTYGIFAYGDVIDNTVSGLSSGGGNMVYGISATSAGGEISGNTVRGFMLASGKSARAIFARSTGMTLRNNHVVSAHSHAGSGSISGQGIYNGGFCGDNTVAGFGVNISAGCKAFAGPNNSGG